MRLTTRTDLAMRALMYCAHCGPRVVRKAEIAAVCDVNENHLGQVIHVLGLRGFLATRRGRQGGVTLARPAAEISVGSVFRALEAELPLAECFEHDGGRCPLRGVCGLKCLLAQAMGAFYDKLDEKSLADLLPEDGSLERLFGPSRAAAEPGGLAGEDESESFVAERPSMVEECVVECREGN